MNWRHYWHLLEHILGVNHGTVECWWETDILMVGFKCNECGRIDGVHESVTN